MLGRKPFSGNQHPNQLNCGSSGLCSRVAGRYQFKPETWAGVARALELPDFSPLNQDIAAVYLIDQKRGMLDNVLKGASGIPSVLTCNSTKSLSYEWAGLPPYCYSGQRGSASVSKAVEDYKRLFLPTAKQKKDRVWKNIK